MIDKQAELLLKKAADDEVMARFPGAPDGPFGFEVQQTIETLLKALLSQLGVEFRFTHDLEYLTNRLEAHGEQLPQTALEFAKIQSFAVVHRYDDIPEVAVLDRADAPETVRVLRQFIANRIADLSATP
jgi:HEPN domain-containing protein